MSLRGEYHDASHCTIDGRACWVACLVDDVPTCRGRRTGRIRYDLPDYASEHGTADEAVGWLRARLMRHGAAGAPIVDTTTHERG